MFTKTEGNTQSFICTQLFAVKLTNQNKEYYGVNNNSIYCRQQTGEQCYDRLHWQDRSHQSPMRENQSSGCS